MKIKTASAILLLGACVFFVWQRQHPSDPRQIRKELERIAALASIHPPESGLVRLAKARQLADYFGTNVSIKVDFERYHDQEVISRRELFQELAAARARLPETQVKILDVRVEINPGKTAALAHFTVLLEMEGADSVEALEFVAALEKGDSGWQINRVETVRTVH